LLTFSLNKNDFSDRRLYKIHVFVIMKHWNSQITNRRSKHLKCTSYSHVSDVWTLVEDLTWRWLLKMKHVVAKNIIINSMNNKQYIQWNVGKCLRIQISPATAYVMILMTIYMQETSVSTYDTVICLPASWPVPSFKQQWGHKRSPLEQNVHFQHNYILNNYEKKTWLHSSYQFICTLTYTWDSPIQIIKIRCNEANCRVQPGFNLPWIPVHVHVYARSEVFSVTESINEVFLENQPCENGVVIQHFRDTLCLHHQG
jgi:hypothetical protein